MNCIYFPQNNFPGGPTFLFFVPKQTTTSISVTKVSLMDVSNPGDKCISRIFNHLGYEITIFLNFVLLLQL